METATSENKTFVQRMMVKYNIHLHVILTHFPISFFMASAGFIVLHLFTKAACFELSGYLCLIAGVVMTVPTAITGWSTWKSKYKGARTRIFNRKIKLSILMMGVGVLMIFFRAEFIAGEHTLWHFIFAFGFIALFMASMIEGHYGGRLNHR
jgi:uncharacterized membrane protein